jgi:hypothetical protein
MNPLTITNFGLYFVFEMPAPFSIDLRDAHIKTKA